jgi:hypothetical protein
MIEEKEFPQVRDYVLKVLPEIIQREPEVATIIEGILAEHSPRHDRLARLLVGKGDQQEMWDKVQQLQGKTLKTLDQGKPFDVVAVTTEKVVVRPHVRDLERPIEQTAIQGAWQELTRRGELTLVGIKKRYSDWNPVYVAAILATLPGVTYRLRPLRLAYRP